MLHDAEEVVEEALLGDVDAQELRHLVQHDHESDPRLEAGQHRRGNEVGDESQAHQPRQEQHRADQRGQGGRRRDKLRRVAVRHGQSRAAVPARIASVVVELTLSTRDEPSSA